MSGQRSFTEISKGNKVADAPEKDKVDAAKSQKELKERLDADTTVTRTQQPLPKGGRATFGGPTLAPAVIDATKPKQDPQPIPGPFHDVPAAKAQVPPKEVVPPWPAPGQQAQPG